MSPWPPIRNMARTTEILFEWLAAFRHKSLMASWFLLDRLCREPHETAKIHNLMAELAKKGKIENRGRRA